MGVGSNLIIMMLYHPVGPSDINHVERHDSLSRSAPTYLMIPNTGVIDVTKSNVPLPKYRHDFRDFWAAKAQNCSACSKLPWAAPGVDGPSATLRSGVFYPTMKRMGRKG